MQIFQGSGGYSTSGLSNFDMAGADKYPDPFADIASFYMPSDIKTMFNMTEYLWLTMPPFQEVGTKVVSYFVTEFEYEGGTEDERKDLKKFFEWDMELKKSLIACGKDLLIYGQSFVSVYIPFKRLLVCPTCGTVYPMTEIDYEFVADSKEPYFKCICKNPSCPQTKVKFKRVDKETKDRSKVQLIRWNPKHIEIAYHPISGSKRISVDLGKYSRFSTLLKEGSEFYLKDTPWSMVRTICAGTSMMYEFNEDSIYHMAGHTMAGLDNFRGWAIPSLLSCFKLAFYIQLLRRYDEAFVLDFIMPFRVIYPETGPVGQDPLASMPMSDFVGKMQQMIARKRKNITDIQIAPYKIGYQMLGGEGKAMSPKDNIEMAMSELLNSVGFPVEMYQSNLQIQVAPVALRLFERRWIDLVDGFNKLVSWMFESVKDSFGWSSDMEVKLRSITMADDMERRVISLQAAAGGDISKTNALSQFGIDFREEQEKVIDEQNLIEKLQREAAAEHEISQMAGSATGEPTGDGAPGYDITMDDIRGQAQDLAQQLLFQVPEGQRRGQLMDIKQTNPTLHALTLQAMNEIRQQMRSDGQSMIMEQQRQAAMQGGMQKQGSFKRAEFLPSPEYIRLLILNACDGLETDKQYFTKLALDSKHIGNDTFNFVYGLATGKYDMR